ncbi:iron chaperone [Labedella endophytica]|uniref:DUF1801 domain-containing protein n=1 Tax=Labedella endophytica TaxID=1523160 RepID=A0A3S0XYA0_9MICO|nr:DUF1801 domain-containing protein [Labedella endophytica]RUQ99046.1 DUF1801 domain-containing protein [Labedella endophytica]
MAETSEPTDARTDDEQDGFSDKEKAAMKERAAELRKQKRGAKKDPEADLLEKIAEMPHSDRAIASRIHELVTEHAPSLTSKTWYGMPGWAKNGKVLCFFQGAAKFDTRYAALGFNDIATLDDGTMWPTAYAITEMNAANEKLIIGLLKKAVQE